jgi:hypothetical protein
MSSNTNAGSSSSTGGSYHDEEVGGRSVWDDQDSIRSQLPQGAANNRETSPLLGSNNNHQTLGSYPAIDDPSPYEDSDSSGLLGSVKSVYRRAAGAISEQTAPYRQHMADKYGTSFESARATISLAQVTSKVWMAGLWQELKLRYAEVRTHASHEMDEMVECELLSRC